MSGPPSPSRCRWDQATADRPAYLRGLSLNLVRRAPALAGRIGEVAARTTVRAEYPRRCSPNPTRGRFKDAPKHAMNQHRHRAKYTRSGPRNLRERMLEGRKACHRSTQLLNQRYRQKFHHVRPHSASGHGPPAPAAGVTLRLRHPGDDGKVMNAEQTPAAVTRNPIFRKRERHEFHRR